MFERKFAKKGQKGGVGAKRISFLVGGQMILDKMRIRGGEGSKNAIFVRISFMYGPLMGCILRPQNCLGSVPG